MQAKEKAAVKQEDAFFDLVRKQQLYFGELLQGGAADRVDAELAAASPRERRAMLEALRQLYVVVQPDR
jgi:hypothetical protein